MADIAQTVRPERTGAKSVQEYIDELPAWADGTSLSSAPMTSMQWLIWSLAAAGEFFEGYVVFITGVALPLIVRQCHIGAAGKGIVGAASLANLGEHSEHQPRPAGARRLRFPGLGCDRRYRGRLPRSNRDAHLVGFAVDVRDVLLLALAVTIGRFFIIESANWLVVRGDHREAQRSVMKLLTREPQFQTNVKLPSGDAKAKEDGEGRGKPSFVALFNSRNRRATIFVSVPWFLQDLGTYGIGIFTPTTLAAALGGSADTSAA
jgi:hypothetical protein